MPYSDAMATATYSAEERQAALELYLEHGAAEASRRTGIAANTISQWARRAGVTMTRANRTAAATEAAKLAWAERRATMVDDMGQVATMALERARAEVAGGDLKGAKDAALTMAILVDKAQLLSGAATGRHEHVTVDSIDAEVKRLADQLHLSDRDHVDA